METDKQGFLASNGVFADEQYDEARGGVALSKRGQELIDKYGGRGKAAYNRYRKHGGRLTQSQFISAVKEKVAPKPRRPKVVRPTYRLRRPKAARPTPSRRPAIDWRAKRREARKKRLEAIRKVQEARRKTREARIAVMKKRAEERRRSHS